MSFFRRRPFLAFYILSLLIALAVTWVRQLHADAYFQRTGEPFAYNEVIWAGLAEINNGHIYPNIISIARVALDEPIFFGVFVFAGAPTLAALIVSWLGWGPSGVAKLLARLKFWEVRALRRDALWTYVALALVFFGFCLGYIGVIHANSGMDGVRTATTLWGWPAALYPLAFLMGGFIDEGATSEELGWRGFALPLLLERMASPLLVSVFLGVAWWAWHLPREIPDLLRDGVSTTFVVNQGHFVLLTISESVVMTYCFHRTGSAIPGILLHGWGNFFTKALPYQEALSNGDVRLWGFVAAAILLTLLAGPSLGRSRYLALKAKEAQSG